VHCLRLWREGGACSNVAQTIGRLSKLASAQRKRSAGRENFHPKDTRGQDFCKVNLDIGRRIAQTFPPPTPMYHPAGNRIGVSQKRSRLFDMTRRQEGTDAARGDGAGSASNGANDVNADSVTPAQLFQEWKPTGSMAAKGYPGAHHHLHSAVLFQDSLREKILGESRGRLLVKDEDLDLLNTQAAKDFQLFGKRCQENRFYRPPSRMARGHPEGQRYAACFELTSATNDATDNGLMAPMDTVKGPESYDRARH